ncbi:MAG: T9SS type A sorting domain-containing protein [Bacteroidetes bacterium]|nr:T9SS type A sorting domain-containing protein [Bacteroidota bacterium]
MENVIRKLNLLMLLVFFGSSLMAQVNLTSGLVAYYPFDNSTADFSGNNNNGTAFNNTWYIQDRNGNAFGAISMGGTSNQGRVQINNSPTLQFTTAASFSCWFRLSSNVASNGFGNPVAGGNHCLFSKEGDQGNGLHAMASLSGSNLTTFVGNVSMTNISAITPSYTINNWVHYCYIMDATEQRMYINGVLVATVAGAPNFATMNGRQLTIGRFGYNWYPMNGSVDDFRVYNRVLNQQEITELAQPNPVSMAVTGVSPATICAGDSITVNYTFNGTIFPGNAYTLELSDIAGTFNSVAELGSVASQSATGQLRYRIPAGVPSGTQYKIRLRSSMPLTTSPASAATLTINGTIGNVPPSANYRYAGSLGNRHFYFHYSGTQTWGTAQTNCAALGGHLAVIPDATTNIYLTRNLNGNVCHIGFTDQVTEGNFQWVNGIPVTYTNWNSGEPNNSGNEDFGTMNSAGFWNDVNGSASFNFYLELRPVSSPAQICAGSTLTLTAMNVAGAAYSWSGPNGFTSTQQNPQIANVTLAASGTYTVTISANGCSSSFTTTTTVLPQPLNIGQTQSLPVSLSTGLVLHYPMNGNANDVSGNNNNGTIFGGALPAADRFGNPNSALSFDGVNDYIDVPDGTYFTGSSFSISCWFYARTYANWSRIIDFSNGTPSNNVLLALTNGNSSLQALVVNVGATNGPTLTVPNAPAANRWQHITATWSNGTATIYLNGVAVASGAISTPANVVRTINYIGRSPWAGDAYANAIYDDLRIYNRALTAGEVQLLTGEQPFALAYQSNPASTCPNTTAQIVLLNSQPGISYQLQLLPAATNVGAAQTGNGDTLFFTTGTITANTNFQLVATNPATGCVSALPQVQVSLLNASFVPTGIGASRCDPGTVTISASGAGVGSVYRWYTAATGGPVLFTGQNFTTPFIYTTTVYYVSVFNGTCESGRTAVTATVNYATAPAVDLYSGQIMRLDFDNNLADSSGSGNDMLFWSTVGYTTDRNNQPNSAIQTTGSGHLYMNNPLGSEFNALNNQVTISIWVNQQPGNWGLYSPLLNKYNSFGGLYMAVDNYYSLSAQRQENRVRWRVSANTFLNSNTDVPYNEWHHIVCVYGGNQLRIYQNGVLTGTLNDPNGITNTAVDVKIGEQSNGLGNANWLGKFDDVIVYNRALNADEIMALYNNGSVAFANDPLCEGGTLQLSSPVIAGAAYQWSGPNSFSSTQAVPAAMPNATTALAGTYSLVITNPNGCVSSPQLQQVVINPLPGAPAVQGATVCGSGNATLTATGGSGYAWYSSPTSTTVLDNDSSYTINNLTATDTFYVSIISAAGCQGPRAAVIATFNQPVNTSYISTGATVCNSTSSAVVNLQSSQAGVSYQTFAGSAAVGNAVTGTGSALSISIPVGSLAAGNNVITIQATQPGCGTVTLTDTSLVNVVVPAVPVVTASGPLTFCTGGSVTLTAGNASSWLWSNSATSQSITVNQSGTFTVSATDAFGCSAASQPVTVNVVAPPVASLSSSGPLTFCQGNTVTLTAQGGSSYLWSTGSSSSAITVSSAGSYYVIASNGSCADTSVTVNVTVNTLPQVSVLLTQDTFCISQTQFTLSGASPAGGVWSGNGVSGNNFSAQAAGAGLQTIIYTYTDSLGCSNSASQVVWVDICTGSDAMQVDTFTIYPNPANNLLTITTGLNTPMQFELTDMSGRTVRTFTVLSSHTLDVSEISTGVYLLRSIGLEIKTMKVVIQ